MNFDLRAMMLASDRHTKLCRLLRADGSEWRVTGFHAADRGLEVDAVHVGVPSSEAGTPSRSLPSFRMLEGEPLDRGDLIQWIGPDGDVLFSMPVPVDWARA